MGKRRAEIAFLAALIVLATASRPAFHVEPRIYRVGDFAPQRVESMIDLGVVAIKLLVSAVD